MTPQHDIELIDISPDGKLLTWTENVSGYSKLYVKDLQNKKVREIIPTIATILPLLLLLIPLLFL